MDKKTFNIINFGCRATQADGASLGQAFLDCGLGRAGSWNHSDVVIINTCTVKGPTESAFFTRLETIAQTHPQKAIVIAGCIPQSDPIKVKKYATIGPREHHNIKKIVEEAKSK